MKIHLELHLMSSLCLLSVDDVYEQDGLAAECLMVHKIKPRLSAAQRLPSGSHVVEACWEYKFRAHGQVNAPPLSPAPPLSNTPSSGSRQAHCSRAGDCGPARASQIPDSLTLEPPAPPPIPRLGTLSASEFFPLDPGGRERPLSPGHLSIARCAWGPGSLSFSPCPDSWGPCFVAAVFLSPPPPRAPLLPPLS